MLIVLASAHDAMARAIVAAWSPWGAALCTPVDLSTPGWCHRVGAPGDGAAVIGGQIVLVEGIAGVLTRLAAVQPEELTHIAAADRHYVAAEMTAFLTAFLSALSCRVLNRPSAGALFGPAWRPEQWIRAAALAGIPVLPCQRSTRSDAPAEPRAKVAVDLTVIGDRVFGAADARLTDWAQSLAKAGGVGLLSIGFAKQANGYALATVNPSPDLNSPDKLNAAREILLAGDYGQRP
jgi:hypothetical protein